MPIIQTERLVLRPLTTNDFSAFRQFAADAELTRYMLFYPQEIESETKTFLQHAEQAWTEQRPEAYEFAILREDTLIGTITVEYMDDTQGMLGWILRKDAQGYGYATEAALAIVQWVKEQLPYTELFACCDARNPASARVMERIGMHCINANGSRTYPKTGEVAQEWMYQMNL
ncbi:MAG: GNAT family N-acetyltransferase [Ruminococcus sp.]|nr:GNAT family N-acetyltransferase [Ruminococcus sp.]MDD6586966.1 GNAT family N-acetyltransferase [Ruminococcus sp.]